LLREKTQLGLDIGEKRIKLVMLKKEANMFRVAAYRSIKTPPGVVDGGYISDPLQLSEALKGLARDSGVNPGAPLASAVSGQQVYTRLLSLPRMRLEELRKAALYQAAGFLPLSIEDVAADIYPVREYSDAEGEKTEVSVCGGAHRAGGKPASGLPPGRFETEVGGDRGPGAGQDLCHTTQCRRGQGLGGGEYRRQPGLYGLF
jgi:Tfp pilus assembly PilM family ATPase